MRIGLVCPYDFSFPGGVQNHVLGLAGWLSTNHQVSIIGPGEPSNDDLARYGLSKAQFTSSGRATPVRFNSSVARVNLLPMAIIRLHHWLRSGEFDVVHVHEPFALGISTWAIRFDGGIKVVTCHAAAAHSWPWRLSSAIQLRTCRRIAAAIAVSPSAAKLARTYLPVPVEIIGNGLMVKMPAASVPIPKRRRITFIGRYDEPRKGLQVFLDAIALVREQEDVEAIVLGGGSPRSDEGVTYLGRVTDEVRTGYLQSSTVYVAPQLGNESFGLVLLEAAAAGVPVVASDLPAFRDVLSDEEGDIAVFFPVGDAEGAAAAILEASTPIPDRIRRGVRRARQYDWTEIGAKILRVYQTACR